MNIAMQDAIRNFLHQSVDKLVDFPAIESPPIQFGNPARFRTPGRIRAAKSLTC